MNFYRQKIIIGSLKTGGIGVLPTDTIYGLVGLALKPEAVQRIHKLKDRDTNKPFIILIGEVADLEKFDIKLSPAQQKFLTTNWPGAISVILSCPSPKFEYLHRGTGTIAFRLPSSKPLRELLNATGPLVAPSANPEGQKPAKTIKEAKAYFGNQIDFYLSGKTKDTPSTLVKIEESGKIEILREGRGKLK
ncbi:MAG: L-threonylcarbamoyladenylate synthase [Candidatus Paceibacterota bacterium]|jgi:L-threonylcarbamoyladenylate synthase